MSRFDELIGVPFVWGGREPATGLDCLGVVLHVLAELGIAAADPWQRIADAQAAGWPHVPDLAQRLDDELASADSWVQLARPSELRDGDVLVWPGHVGVLVDGYVLSAAKRIGVHRCRVDVLRRLHGTMQLWRPTCTPA